MQTSIFLLFLLGAILSLPKGESHETRCFTRICRFPDGKPGCRIYDRKAPQEAEECCDSNKDYVGFFPNLTRSGDCYHCFSCEDVRNTVHGGWSDWTRWSQCSKSCGSGKTSRSRVCNNPPRAGLGKPCQEGNKQTKTCNAFLCPIDGVWSPWTAWTVCPVTCGKSKIDRSRTCDNPHPQHGGKDCVGVSSETSVCTRQPCPVDGGWSKWSKWSDCSKTCDCGSRERIRSCNNPSPAHGGKLCKGNKVISEDCCFDPCAIDGGWSKWSDWSHCINRDCSQDLRYETRSRTCTNPSPAYGGRLCKGSFFSTQPCDDDVNCARDGGWGSWSHYKCSSTGVLRTRICNNPSPRFGGKKCNGIEREAFPKWSNIFSKKCSSIVITSKPEDGGSGSGGGSGDFGDQEAGDD